MTKQALNPYPLQPVPVAPKWNDSQTIPIKFDVSVEKAALVFEALDLIKHRCDLTVRSEALVRLSEVVLQTFPKEQETEEVA
ncbi:hypothetical protein [Paraburkholderia xenovorans]|uniref:hypothetical protein n=1 Tax=Paraburkholderia xenovorans TaxID=36873 RepID=UPI0015C532DB|nr:hypothetical protein [Paraburkholderia xenovorans]NPT36339.1 hypothetical protein [Paraburkholderia xenovorans]